MIILYQGPRIGVVPNASPFCTKLELFFRIHNIPYKIKSFDPFKAPKGKMPYIDYNGSLLGDSQLIIDRLSQDLKIDMDSHLNPEQRAIARAVKRMLEEGTYFCGFYLRWAVEENWELTKTRLFSRLPPPLRWILPAKFRKQALKSLYLQGTGRHTYDEIMQMALSDFTAVATFLGNKPYIFGDQITSVDLSVFAFASAFLKVATPKSPAIPALVARPLETYCDRIIDKYFSDLKTRSDTKH